MLKISILGVEGFGPDSHTEGTMACVYHEKETTPRVVIFTCGFHPYKERNHTAFEQRLLSTYGFQFGAHPGMPKCNRSQAICASPWAMGFG